MDRRLELLVPGEEVGGNPDTSTHAVVDQDVAGKKVLGDFIAVRNIDRDSSAAL